MPDDRLMKLLNLLDLRDIECRGYNAGILNQTYDEKYELGSLQHRAWLHGFAMGCTDRVNTLNGQFKFRY